MFSPTAILHPTDFSESARSALRHAVHLARHHDATLHIVHVSTDFGEDPIRKAFEARVDAAGFNKAVRAEAKAQLRALLEPLDTDGLTIETMYERGVAPAPVILGYANAHDVDLIVMGTHGRRGVKRFMLGSVAEEIVRHASCSVLTVRGDLDSDPATIRRVLTPVDLSDVTEPLMETAENVAAAFRAHLDVLHVVEPLPFPVPLLGGITIHDLMPDPEDRAQAQLQEIVGPMHDGTVPVDTHVREGRAAMAILNAADELDADLIVIASHDASRLERVMLGGVTARVVRRAECPVLTVRVPEEALPEASSATEDETADAA